MQHLKQYFIGLILLPFFIFLSSSAWSNSETSFVTDKGVIKSSDIQGQVIYVDFWASWCIPCRKSFPWMNEMQGRYADQGFRVIAVNLDKDRQLVDRFLQTYKADFTIAYDPDGKLAKQYGLKGMPGSYLIGRDGKLKVKHLGFREKDKNKLELAIKKELKH